MKNITFEVEIIPKFAFLEAYISELELFALCHFNQNASYDSHRIRYYSCIRRDVKINELFILSCMFQVAVRL